MNKEKVTKKDFKKWELHGKSVRESTKKYRLQIAFDIKDEYNKSILDKETPNTVSRSIRVKPTAEQIEAFHFLILSNALCQCEDSSQFHSLFYWKIRGASKVVDNYNEDGELFEIPREYLGYRSLIHSKDDNHLIPFLDKELWINRDIFSKSRLLLRQIRYYLSCFYELIRL
jgi:hypothetical protein